MSHETYRTRLTNSIDEALNRAREAESLGHAGLVGLCRELVVDRLLRPLLPAGYDVGTGKIVDSTGQSSRQIDLIIYHRASIPPIMWSERDGVFPIEACRYAIEVKSRMRAHLVKDVYAAARQVLKLKERRRSLGRSLSNTRIPIALFAFSSDVAGMKKELDRFWGLRKGKKPNDLINVICVASNGYAAFDSQVGSWVGDNAREDHGHIVAFLLGIVNTLLMWPTDPSDMLYGPYVCDLTLEDAAIVELD